jgi:hypothetical protein
MMTAPEIIAFVEDRIGHIYARPMMYGGTAEGVELILYFYHELWSMIHQRHDEYQRILHQLYEAEGCGSANFTLHDGRDRPEVSEAEPARSVVEQWRKLDDRLGITILRHAIPFPSAFRTNARDESQSSEGLP